MKSNHKFTGQPKLENQKMSIFQVKYFQLLKCIAMMLTYINVCRKADAAKKLQILQSLETELLNTLCIIYW